MPKAWRIYIHAYESVHWLTNSFVTVILFGLVGSVLWYHIILMSHDLSIAMKTFFDKLDTESTLRMLNKVTHWFTIL